MKVFRLFDIRWDTNGENPSKLGLPAQHIAVVDDDWDAEEEAANLLSDTYGFGVQACSYETLDTPVGEIADSWGSETWEDIGSILKPPEVVRYDLDEPFHPDQANANWEVTGISVMMAGPSLFAFYDQDGCRLHSDAVGWRKVPSLGQILTYLQETM